MIVKSLYIREDQNKFLTKLPGTLSEQVRRAIDEYIESIEGKNVGSSLSKESDKHE
jgi:hypothetical protein